MNKEKLILREYESNGKTIRRWLKPNTPVLGKAGCGCWEVMHARDIGEGNCMLCYANDSDEELAQLARVTKPNVKALPPADRKN